MIDLLDDEGLLDIGGRAHTDPAAVVRQMQAHRTQMPAQNPALRDWQAPDRPKSDACHLCGRPPRMQCQACGRKACSADSWVMLSLCRTCATEERMKANAHDVSENWLG